MKSDYAEHLVEAHRLIRDMNDLLPQRRDAEAEALALKAIHELSRLIAAIHARKAPAIFSEDLEAHVLPRATFRGQWD